jgi:DNA-binding protein HU-beta
MRIDYKLLLQRFFNLVRIFIDINAAEKESRHMNRKELVESVLQNKELSHLSKKDADRFINSFIEIVKRTVKKGEDVSLVGFGTFTKVKRAARTGVNPATGEKIRIKAKTVPKFRPGKEFKDLL